MSVTRIEDIKNKFEQEVDIKGYDEGEFITLRLRRASLLDLVSKGKIPNQLMGIATGLFGIEDNKKKKAAKDEPEDYSSLTALIDIICESVIVEPTYEELKPYLTDEQKMEIYQYSQAGVKGIEKFRKEQGSSKCNINSKHIQETAK